MEEYRSPFRLPGKLKCVNPDDARRFPILHAEAGLPGEYTSPFRKKCPLHYKGNTGEDDWRLWYKYREEYAKLDSGTYNYAYREKVIMQRMLNQVTAANPPDAPVARTHSYDTSKHRLNCWLVLRVFLVAVVAAEVIVSVLVGAHIL